MVVIPGLSPLLEAAGKHITSWDDSGSRLAVETVSVVRSAVCPRCACGSARPHGRFRRWVADCPSFGKPVTIAVEVRRFKCVNPACPRRTFCERMETLVATGRRRTRRLVEALLFARLRPRRRGDRPAGGAPGHTHQQADGAAGTAPCWLPAAVVGARRHRHRRLGAGPWPQVRHDRRRPRGAPPDRAAGRAQRGSGGVEVHQCWNRSTNPANVG